MPVSAATIRAAALTIATIPGIEANPQFVLEDVISLSQVWPNEKDFLTAINSTKQAAELLLSDSVDAASLSYQLEGWSAFHYQHKRGQEQPANMRIVFRKECEKLKVLSFGHRNLPHSVYYSASGRL